MLLLWAKAAVIFMWEIFGMLSKLFYCILHVTGMGSFPKPLSPQQEQAALLRLKQGDSTARTLLIEHNLRLVSHIIKKYYPHISDQEDLISIGTVGLIKAVDTFDPEKGIRLSSYASRCIENEILMHFRSNKKIEREVSINEPIETDKDGNELTILDTLAADTDLIEELDQKCKTEKLGTLLQKELSARERTIIVLRYGLNGSRPLPQWEVAKRLGISRSYVSRIETRALKHLRTKLE